MSTLAEQRRARAANTRTLILVAAALVLVGIALSVSDDEGMGSWLTIAGLVAGIVALHRYGRLGADGPSDRIAPRPEDQDD
jgi:hypothetical protein